ncbi:hypothetical protein CTAYLR_008996 [Chrysophaeum taylorii]|uniref:Uncharacterized protein n=1 Tax=Chrysophaeum taylorii TaxID=2483200 RepID=A0AAD7UJ25_9STRA|nr:hypothetical protein CTAYLR_008996 [Chrysophaeum taylorii]
MAPVSQNLAAAAIALGESSSEESFGEEEIEQEAAALVRRAALTESEKKANKAKADKERKARIAAEDEEQSWRAPRSLRELSTVDWDKEVRAEELLRARAVLNSYNGEKEESVTSWKSKKGALVTAMEQPEASGASFLTFLDTANPRSKVKPVNNRTQLRTVFTQLTCSHLFDARRREVSCVASWKLVNFKRHDPDCGMLSVDGRRDRQDADSHPHRDRRTAYSAEVLAQAAVQPQRGNRMSVPRSGVKAVLAPICLVTPSEDLVTRVTSMAALQLRGKPSDNLKKIKPYIQALQDAGWYAKLLTATADQMNAIAVARARADLKHLNKGRPREKQVTLDEATLPRADPNKVYYRGWVVAPPTTWRMLQGNLIKPVSAADFTRAKHVDGGNFGAVTSYDSNYHITPLVFMHTTENESTESWPRLFREGKEYYGEEKIDTATTVFIVDGDKGGAAAIQNEIHRGRMFLSSRSGLW